MSYCLTSNALASSALEQWNHQTTFDLNYAIYCHKGTGTISRSQKRTSGMVCVLETRTDVRG